MKKVFSAIVILLFLVSVGLLIYSTITKNSVSSYWGNKTNPNGFWFSGQNKMVSSYKVIERTTGYIHGYEQQDDSPYFMKMKISDESGNNIHEVNIPRSINTDIIKLTNDEIADKIAGGGAVIVSIAKDTQTSKEYLDYIAFLKTE